MTGVLLPRYAIPVLLAIAIALLFPATKHMPREERRRYWLLQVATMFGAVFGAKLVALMGDHFWPFVPMQTSHLLTSGRSIVGGLIFGFLAAEAAKPLLGYTLPPNDRFATIIPFSVATGRLGCHLQGCCLGLEHHGWFSVAYADGIPRYPVQLMEVAFHAAIGIAFIVLLRRQMFAGRLFAIYLVVYGGYRLLTEMIRATPRVAGSWSVYQFFCIVMIALGMLSFVARTPRLEESHE